MANSKLRGKMFPVPYKVLKELHKNLNTLRDKKDSKGFNRSLFILNRKACSYEQLKRIKNYFDNLDDNNFDEIEFMLNGGELMKNWVNDTLKTARNDIKFSKTARSNAGLENQFRKNDDLSVGKPPTPNVVMAPDIMSTSDLKEELTRIINLIK